jgi:Na+/H+ antiporter family protein
MLCIAFIYKTLPVILRDLYKFVKYLIIFFELLNKKILSYKISNQQILHNGVFVKNFFKSLFKLSPIFLLASLMIISNISVLSEMTGIKLNILIIAPIATCYAFIVAMLTEKFKFADILDAAVANVKEMQIVFFILMLAYALADSFMYTGVGAAIINISMKVGLSARTVAVISLLISSCLSVATGSSWGTFAACAPIFLWLTHILGGNVLLSLCAVAGGSCFGDNLGLISDVTVVSSAIHKVEITDRMKSQGAWSLFVLVVSSVLFLIASLSLPTGSVNPHAAIDAIPAEVWEKLRSDKPAAVNLLNQVKQGVPLYMVIPMIVVIATALKGISTVICLVLGLVSCFILGAFAGTVTSVSTCLDLMYNGFADAGSWVIAMMMWVAAFGGVMRKMNAFKPLADISVYISKNVRQLLFWNGAISLLGNAALADEMAQITTMGPIIKDITDENIEGDEKDMYRIRLRNATFSSALGVFGSQLIPWHVYLSYFVGVAATVYPLQVFNQIDLIKQNYLAIIAVSSLLLFTIIPIDKFIPGFSIPTEPKVHIKK